MDTKDNNNPFASAGAKSLIEQIDALQPGKQQQKMEQFQMAYPAIERALRRAVTQRSIIAELEKTGLRLSIGGFRSLLEAERNRLKEQCDQCRCSHCGSYLPRHEHERREENGTEVPL